MDVAADQVWPADHSLLTPDLTQVVFKLCSLKHEGPMEVSGGFCTSQRGGLEAHSSVQAQSVSSLTY